MRNRPIHACGTGDSLAPKNGPSVRMKKSAALRYPLPIATWRRCSRNSVSYYFDFSYLQIESFGLRKSFPGPRPSAFAGVFDFVFSRQKLAAKNASTNATLIFERAPGRTNRRQRNKATRHGEKTPTLKSNRVEWTTPPTSNRRGSCRGRGFGVRPSGSIDRLRLIALNTPARA